MSTYSNIHSKFRNLARPSCQLAASWIGAPHSYSLRKYIKGLSGEVVTGHLMDF